MQRIKMSIKHEMKEERVTVIQEPFRKKIEKMLACFTAYVLLDFLVTVKAAPQECIIRTGLS